MAWTRRHVVSIEFAAIAAIAASAASVLAVGCGDSSPARSHAAPDASFDAGPPAKTPTSQPPPSTRCLEKPSFGEPIVLVARSGSVPFGFGNAWMAQIDDRRVLVVAEAGGVVGGGDLSWTMVDLRTRNVDAWKSLVPAARTVSLASLRNGVAGLQWYDGNQRRADLRVFTGSGWSPSLADSFTPISTLPSFAVESIGDGGAVVTWLGGASTFHGGAWTTPLRFTDDVAQLSALDGGSTSLVLAHFSASGRVASALVASSDGRWATSGASPLVATEWLSLADGTTIVALVRHRNDGTSEIWTASARPPGKWSTPSPLVGDDGAPLLVRGSEFATPTPSRLLFPLGPGAQLVAWTTPCAASDCPRKPVVRRFVDGAWTTDSIDLSWGNDSPLETHRVIAIDRRVPIVLRGNAFRVRLDDDGTWSDPMGVSDTSLDEWTLMAATSDGIWVRAPSSPTTSAHLLFVDTRRHTAFRHDVEPTITDRVASHLQLVFVDDSGAFVIVDQSSLVPTTVYRWTTPDADASTTPKQLPDEAPGQTVRAAFAPGVSAASETIAVRALVGGTNTVRLRVSSWNEMGRADVTKEAPWLVAYQTSSRGCGGAVLYGTATSSTVTQASTLILLPAR